ncbi:MAG: hypothetical protein ACE5EH_09655 [Gammaproteobacteria bacterium]
MTCKVLTAERWKGLLEGSLSSGEASELIAHLQTDCDDCDEFFLHMDDGGEVDMREVFNKLKALEKASTVYNMTSVDVVPDVLDQDSLPTQSSLIKHGFLSTLTHANPMRPAFAAGFAVMLVLAIFMAPGVETYLEPQQTMKGYGETDHYSVNLDFATAHRVNGSGLIVDRGIIGNQYSPRDLLFLHYSLPVDGYVQLIGYQLNEEPEILNAAPGSHQKLQTAGKHTLPSGQRSDGFSLADLSGRYYIVSLFSPQPLIDEEAMNAAVKQSINRRTGVVSKPELRSILEVDGQSVSVEMIYFDVVS